MSKLSFEPFPVAAWVEMDRQAAAPTFFARPAWALAVQRTHSHLVPWPLSCHLEDGSHAIIPLMRGFGGRLPWKVLSGMPFGGYTAVLTQQSEHVEPSVAGRVLQALLRQGDAVELNAWPLARPRVDASDIKKMEEASVIDISGGVEAALSRVGSKSARMAGQARRRGVTCAIESDEGAVGRYYELLRDAAQMRWNLQLPVLSQEFLRQVVSAGEGSAEVWIVRFEGAPIAGGVALYGSQEVAIWTTAMRTEMEVLRPHNILHLNIIEHAAKHGMHWYNLLSSANLPGVLRFKKALGATSLPYEILGRESLPWRFVRALKRLRRE